MDVDEALARARSQLLNDLSSTIRTTPDVIDALDDAIEERRIMGTTVARGGCLPDLPAGPGSAGGAGRCGRAVAVLPDERRAPAARRARPRRRPAMGLRGLRGRRRPRRPPLKLGVGRGDVLARASRECAAVAYLADRGELRRVPASSSGSRHVNARRRMRTRHHHPRSSLASSVRPGASTASIAPTDVIATAQQSRGCVRLTTVGVRYWRRLRRSLHPTTPTTWCTHIRCSST